MVKNKLIDLNNILFEQLERLNDEELRGSELETEVMRSKAMIGVSSQIIKTQGLALKSYEITGKETENTKLLEG